MDIILDEARTRGMKVWILDDSHFPTGYCNGKMEEKPDVCRRWFLTYKVLGEVKENEEKTWESDEYERVRPFEPTWIENYFHMSFETFSDDRWIGAVAVKKNGSGVDNLRILSAEGGKLSFHSTDGVWKIYSCQLTRNRGPHRNYMNMLDQEACRTLIETVYEPHYAHYADDFGTTIAGFFSDEPEIGNGHLYQMDQKIYENEDQPWSRSLQTDLEQRWGADYLKYLPLLWEQEFDEDLTAKVRYGYMDLVTRRVETDFSMQIGDWCREHGVQYIGHLIEDNNHASKTGSSLGHFFRGLAGQDMAGIDDIGGQVMPGQEDVDLNMPPFRSRNGSFYHYGLGKLGSSAAAIEPLKNGDSMCEIFGAYGWAEGVRLEKYLLDHFMVRGINHFVPHAFSGKDYPDPDCPPHFYAHGNNPQYRHFGALMAYGNRVLELINGGRHIAPAAILYHGESDWMGETMASDIVGHQLYDEQIDYDYIPQDVFLEENAYDMEISEGAFRVNTQEYQALIVPKLQFVTPHMKAAVKKLQESHFPVYFIDGLPDGVDGEVVPLTEIAPRLRGQGAAELSIAPENNRVRYYHYEHRDGSAVYCSSMRGTRSMRAALRSRTNGHAADMMRGRILYTKQMRYGMPMRSRQKWGLYWSL